MKTVFFLWMFFMSHASFAQIIGTDTLGKKVYNKISFDDGFVIYQPSCTDKNFYLNVSGYIIRYDSIKRVGYLKSHTYDTSFQCQKLGDLSLVNNLKTLVDKEQRLNTCIGLLVALKSKNEEFIAALFIFKKKKFSKYIKKADRTIRRKNAFGSGETAYLSIYDLNKSHSEFFFGIVNGTLVSYRVR